MRRLEEISAVSELGVTRGEAARRARMLEAVQTKERRLEEMERGSRGDREEGSLDRTELSLILLFAEKNTACIVNKVTS